MQAPGGRRWTFASAGLGAAAWLATPWVPAIAAPSFGSIEHVFLLFPLVAAPFALLLLAELLDPRRGPTPLGLRIARRMQPPAAALVLVSFFVAKGTLAGLLAVGWLVMAVLVATGGLEVVRRGRGANLSNVSLLMAHLFLPVGAVWLLLSRLGTGPRHFTEVTVLLAAVHFHFSGFGLQLLIASTGRELGAGASRIGAVHRAVAIGAIAGLVLIAAGNALSVPALKLLGVASMTVSATALAMTTAATALASRSPVGRGLLLVSSLSIAAGMALAGVYGVGELEGAAWIGVPRMAQVHGLLDAVGFTLCGLIGHLAGFLHRRPASAGIDRAIVAA